jgi:hypothetical protein
MSYIDVEPEAFTCESVRYCCLRPRLTLELARRERVGSGGGSVGDAGRGTVATSVTLLFEGYSAKHPGSGQTTVTAEAGAGAIGKGLGSLAWR